MSHPELDLRNDLERRRAATHTDRMDPNEIMRDLLTAQVF